MKRCVFSVCVTADDITAGAAEFCDGMTLKLWRKRKLAISVTVHNETA